MGEGTEKVKERLPVEKRAELLAGESSVFFNIAKFEHAQRIADMFARSTMVPDHFRNSIGNCMIAINYATRMRIDPFMAMQSMYVVKGRPGIEGKLVAALLNSSGKYRDPLKYKWVDDSDQEVAKHLVYNGNPEKTPDFGCIAYATDAKSGEVVTGPKISWKIVSKEGWYKKEGSKWQTVPELMFMYRAAAWFANTNCPEVKMGMMTVEEIEDIIDLHQQENGTYSGDVTEKTKQRLEDLKEKMNNDDSKEPESPPEGQPDDREIHPWDRSNWINIRKAGFSTFVHKNLDTFENLSSELQAEIIDKWNKLYNDPFPTQKAEVEQSDPETEKDENSSNEVGSGTDYETLRVDMRAELERRLIGNDIFQLKSELGMPVSSWPSSYSGMSKIYENAKAKFPDLEWEL